MRVVLDTNVLVSALLISVGPPAAVYRAWCDGRFVLLTSAEQLEELRATLLQAVFGGSDPSPRCRTIDQRTEEP